MISLTSRDELKHFFRQLAIKSQLEIIQPMATTTNPFLKVSDAAKKLINSVFSAQLLLISFAGALIRKHFRVRLDQENVTN